LAILLACQPIVVPTAQPSTGEISFETLSLNETGDGVNVTLVTEETQLLFVTSLDQVAALQQMVSAEDFVQLQQVDFQIEVVVALFCGVQGSSNSQTMIKEIKREDGRLVIQAEFWSPSPSYTSTAALTYPYHLVTIAKVNLPVQEVEFTLERVMLTPTPPGK